MVDYRSYDVENLAADEMFRRWVIGPTLETNAFWQQWLAENPDRAHTVSRARELVLAVEALYEDELTDEQLAAETDRISQLAALRKNSRRRLYWPALWKAAAVITLVSGLGWQYYSSRNTPELPAARAIEIQTAQVMESRTNQTAGEMTVLLSDNSVATLSKGSSISFPKDFEKSERRVYLEGEAFFDVAKDPARPFLVFANETVTRVLGTSFRVKAFDHDNTVLVAVKTGRVSVYPEKEYRNNIAATKHNAGIELTPNQQAIFLRKEGRLEKGIVARPEMLAESTIQKEQVFDDKPVTEVFRSLEKAYGIQVHFNAETLDNCYISAQFNDENLKQRLNAICDAIDAHYEIVAGQVVVNAKGCQ